MTEKIALLLGASGSVGAEVLQVLLNHSAYKKVVIFVRSPIKKTGATSSDKLIQTIVPQMTTVGLAKSVAETLNDLKSKHDNPEFMAFSALGVGANTAKLTIDQHRTIDVELNKAFALALKDNPQVKSMGLLSAVGADPTAKTTGSGAAGMARYARVKGEAEEAVKASGPKIVDIFRPAMIRGSQHTPKILEAAAPIFDFLVPKKFHSISTRKIAEAMVAASLISERSSGTYEYSQMAALLGEGI